MSKLTSGFTRDRAATRVCFDRKLVSQLEQVEDALNEAEKLRGPMLGDDKVPALRKQAEKLRKQVSEKSDSLVFESIGRRAWDSFKAEYPPTDEQIKDAREKGGMVTFNPETFPPAAMVRTCVEPEWFDEDDARVICEELPFGRFLRVWDAVLTANESGAADPFDPESATRNGSAKKSKPRSASVSPSASS